MGRRSKYNDKTADLIIRYISLGYTIKDTAYATDVSDETIRRWRLQYPDFNKRLVEASNQQWERPEQLIKYKQPSYRAYKRPKIALSAEYGAKTVTDTSESEKPLLEALRPSKRQTMYGLPVRPEGVKELVKTPPYYNASNGQIEWVDYYNEYDRRMILHRCSIETYKRRLERQNEPFIAVAF